jgi:hypothetical protein
MSNLGGGLRPIDWNTLKIQRFEKNFYVEDKRVASRSDKEVEEFRRMKEIKASRFQHVPQQFIDTILRNKGSGT